jgi:hypothetical protein
VEEARSLLESTLLEAESLSQPEIAQRCHTSLGLLAARAGDMKAAEAAFERAVKLIEDLRAPLPAEEFRTAFFADKLIPYNELVRLCLEDESRDRASEALCYIERARSRALVDLLGGTLKQRVQPRDPFEAEKLARLEEIREELMASFYKLLLAGHAPAAALRGAQLQLLEKQSHPFFWSPFMIVGRP